MRSAVVRLIAPHANRCRTAGTRARRRSDGIDGNAHGSAALAANLTCLALLWRFRRKNVNMSSTFECSRNDVAFNVGVLLAAGLVAATGAAWPDVAVGGVIAIIFLRSAWTVLAEAIPAWRDARCVVPEVMR